MVPPKHGMRLRCAVLAVALALSAQGCDESTRLTGPSESNAPPGPSGTGIRFTGRVVDYVTQSAAAAAAVVFTDAQFGPSQTTTNADGQYVLTVPRTGVFSVAVEGVVAGTARVNGTAYVGDLLIHRGTCAARYGLAIDSRTLRPIEGAAVTLSGRTVITGADGWYRLDLSCPDVIMPAGTTVISVMHPDYQWRQQVVGRGVSGVRRLDLDLQRR